jgi:lipopolysaccharide transport system ATP-binding protein
MSDIAVSADNLSKLYRIGSVGSKRNLTFRDLMVQTAKDAKDRIFNPAKWKESNQSIDFWALRDVSFELKDGDRLGIIGHNGAGKSTLLKILSQITEPTAGTAKLKGRVASLLEVGTGFHPELTGRENIYLRGAILGMTRNDIRRKFDDIVEFSGTGAFLETPIKRFSTGMYVRLAFSVGAHLEPDILIVDEVLAVGDADFQKKCLSKMDSVSREGRTVIFVSHSLGSVVNLCNRGLLLDHGKLVLNGTIQEVVGRYLRIGAADDEQPGVFRRANLVDSRDVITKVEVLDKELQPQSSFEYGAPLHVRIHTNPGAKRDFGIGMRIRNSRYEMLAHAASWIAQRNNQQGYKSGDTILISFPPLPFVEDDYFIEFFLRDPLSFQPVENVFDLVHFNVMNTRPLGSPININTQADFGGIVWEDVSFKVAGEATQT